MTAATLLRNEPVQARSRTRLEQITEATREAIATLGYERFTTADVAHLAGCSIGTVYRYVPDRVALLDLVDPDRYVFAEVREVPKCDAEWVDGELLEHLTDVRSRLRFEQFDRDPQALREALVNTMSLMQQKVVAMDAAAKAAAQ